MRIESGGTDLHSRTSRQLVAAPSTGLWGTSAGDVGLLLSSRRRLMNNNGLTGFYYVDCRTFMGDGWVGE